MDHDSMIAVIQANRDGKPVEWRYKNRGGPFAWTLMLREPHNFNFQDFDYRVKPEPPKPREWWLGRCPGSGSGEWKVWECKPPIGCHQCEIVHVRETLDENS